MADIFTFTAIITGLQIRVEMDHLYEGKTEVVFTEARPATLADADHALAAHGFGRVRDWDLGPNGDVRARVRMIDNEFGGTRAARLWDAIGTTHEELDTVVVGIRDGVPTVDVGDLITDMDESELYVVAGARFECGTARIHMVREGETWEDRYTGEFPFGQVVKVARRKA
jgi:hypothetical protein